MFAFICRSSLWNSPENPRQSSRSQDSFDDIVSVQPSILVALHHLLSCDTQQSLHPLTTLPQPSLAIDAKCGRPRPSGAFWPPTPCRLIIFQPSIQDTQSSLVPRSPENGRDQGVDPSAGSEDGNTLSQNSWHLDRASGASLAAAAAPEPSLKALPLPRRMGGQVPSSGRHDPAQTRRDLVPGLYRQDNPSPVRFWRCRHCRRCVAIPGHMYGFTGIRRVYQLTVVSSTSRILSCLGPIPPRERYPPQRFRLPAERGNGRLRRLLCWVSGSSSGGVVLRA